MEKKSGFLETEEAIHLLLAELGELKSAVEFIDATSEAASRVAKASETLTKKTAELVGAGSSVFKALQEARVNERLQELKESATLALERSDAVSGQIGDVEEHLNDRLTDTESLLSAAEERQEAIAGEVSKVKMRQMGLIIGLVITVALQVAVIALLASG